MGRDIMSASQKIRVGTEVKVKHGVIHTCPKGRENHRTAKIQTFLSDTDGGVMVDRDLRGCLYWNLEDLEAIHK